MCFNGVTLNVLHVTMARRFLYFHLFWIYLMLNVLMMYLTWIPGRNREIMQLRIGLPATISQGIVSKLEYVKSNLSEIKIEQSPKPQFRLGLHTTISRGIVSKLEYVNTNRSEIKIRKSTKPNAIFNVTVLSKIESAIKYGNVTEKFFQPRRAVVNKMDAEFLISNENFCNEATPFLLVMVPSIHRNADVRDAIRNTYGSYKQHGNLTVKLVFLFGTSSELSDRDIQQESTKYGDIIQADFIDSYEHLTYKILYGLKWVSLHCNQAKFVLKADEDVFVYMSVLLDFLVKTPYGDEGAIYGYIYSESRVQRKGRWAVTYEQYPLKHFPKYASGTCYTISGNIVSRLFVTSEHMPYVPIEDAFITGCLAKIIGAKKVHNREFSQWLSKKPVPCEAVRSRLISSTKTDLNLFSQLWEAMTHFDVTCGTKKRRG